MPRIIDLEKTRYDWIEGEDGILLPDAPTLTEISGGKNISKYVVQSTAIMAAASDTVNERSVIDNANSSAPTIGNYTGTLNLFRDGDPETGEFSADDPAKIFSGRGIVGWIVKRTGKKHSAAYATGDDVETFLFMTDNPQKTGGAQDGYLKLIVPLLPQGSFSVNAEVGGTPPVGGG